MKRSTFNKWLAVLRSGDYEQGHCVLRDLGNKYCCLGVLCDITNPTKWESIPGAASYGWEGSAATLPRSLIELYNFSNDIGGPVGKSLVALNDAGIPFITIAERLEASPSQFGISIEED